jgi:hypothetical protein
MEQSDKQSDDAASSKIPSCIYVSSGVKQYQRSTAYNRDIKPVSVMRLDVDRSPEIKLINYKYKNLSFTTTSSGKVATKEGHVLKVFTPISVDVRSSLATALAI